MKKLAIVAAVAYFCLLVPLMILMPASMASAAAVCGPGGQAQDVQGTHLDEDQLGNAETIISTEKASGMPARAAVIAVATAMQESSLHNDLVQRDHDSIGLFQQRISIYGAEVAGDPVKSTKAFLAGLAKVPNWETIPLTEAAADVQKPREDLRGAYAKWEPLATSLVGQLLPGAVQTCTSGTDDPAASAGGGIPPGYQLPTSGQAAVAVKFALQQLGKPYIWGGEGPDGYDCSGLMQASWAAAGVPIPRVADAQSRFGMPVPGAAFMQPGDLIFIPGADGTATDPGHVGMYIGLGGDGKQYLVQAPHTGDVVKASPVSNWGNEIVAIRRPVTKG